tara:strand:+ start:55 stop:225 length:171 start_codon:yes stop_codon:yes gene_type:complete
MNMTRQHFELVAKVLKETKASKFQALCFANEFINHNKAFNMDKFLKASGYEELKEI